MVKPIVAIVGRPNVGKSTLFNRLVGRRQALVDDQPGVTRDRHYGDADWLGFHFIVIDTGGIEMNAKRSLVNIIKTQSLLAVEEADVIICLFDGADGPTPVDRYIVDILRKTNRPILYAVNKVDSAGHEDRVAEFYSLGVEPLIPISSEHGRRMDDLLDKLIEKIKKFEVREEASDATRVAVVGRPNVGKSTLINRLAGKERVIVHEEAGTTRDTIDVEVGVADKKYIFVDTAGIKRKGKTPLKLEKLTTIKSLRAIGRADVVLILVDAKEGLTRQDMHLVSFAFSEAKPALILANKWDEVRRDESLFLDYAKKDLGELSRIPVYTISAKTGYNCDKIFKQVDDIRCASSIKIPTSRLNRIFEEIVARHHIPVYKGRPVKLFYATQRDGPNPAFIIFTNYPEGIKEAYKRYIKNSFQDMFDMGGVPITLEFRKRG